MCCVFLSLSHHHIFFHQINRLHAISHLLIPLFQCENLLGLISSSTKARMQKSSSSALMVKQEFFTKWKKGLQIYSAFNKEMTIMERKRAIKLSADVAIASTRSATTQWSRAVVADVSTSAAGAARIAAEEILGRKLTERRKALASKKIVRRRRKAAARGVVRSSAAAVAKKRVRNRTRVLKRLIPG
ncbi:transcription factor IBH1-like 1 [Salvia divinorum]|uniref:Transcription factor IBH1-like 1 n=1 Tax=Salvia divinorum TaxID=28513 RepID=A0ABD1HBL8_SALDI